MDLLVELPLNRLSLCQFGYNVLRELYRRGDNVGVFPIGLNDKGEGVDLSAYKPSAEFMKWLQGGVDKRFQLLKRDAKNLKIWHIAGSDSLRTPNQTLLTFYECSEPTDYEKSIVALQGKTLFSSKYSAEKFSSLNNVGTFSCGFDSDFTPKGDKQHFPDRTVFLLAGKWEVRKQTEKIIRAWVKKYGNNRKYMLNLLVGNPFFKPEDNQALFAKACGNQRVWNINYLPALSTNDEVRQLIEQTDIDLSGLSAGEGWGLPSFNATAMGRWSIVSNNTSHKDWATAENSILIEPDHEFPVYDGVFFRPESPVNHGVFYGISEENMIAAFEKAEKFAKTPNPEGEKLRETFSYKKVVDNILKQL